MEILMKLKCSPSAPGSPSHSTLKVVDHHRQLQQHTLGPPAPHMRGPPQAMPPPNVVGPSHEIMMPSCLDYSGPMDCCSAAAQQDMAEMQQWDEQRRRGSSSIPQQHQHSRNMIHGSGNLEYVGMYDNNSTSYCGPPCCSGIASYASPPPPHPAPPAAETYLSMASAEDFNMRYEYHEPEENFVSIDDAKIKGFLMKIGQEQQQVRSEQEKRFNENSTKVAAPTVAQSVVYEIIELDDEEEREKLKRIKNQAEKEVINTQTSLLHSYPKRPNSPNISLIPRNSETEIVMLPTTATNASQQKIIAQIELLDSSDSEGDGDDEDLTLAAAAVSCELDCDDEDEDEDDGDGDGDVEDLDEHDEIVILPSDDEIDEHEEGLELRWDDLEEQKERNFFECFICGKKVQSSYNLRRHTMIHTGERPFGCDMCDRRFREFSDLKKHRRRHANELNFVCMVCRVNVPTESDPTRCNRCNTKTGALIAASRPQLTTTPDKSQTPPMQSPMKKPPSRNPTPGPPPGITSPPPHNSVKGISQAQPPPLTPINHTAETQLLLDNIPAVHRPSYNQLGMMTRKEFPCPLCQRPFGTRHNLKRHFMIHTGEKPFSCSKCRKPFREYSTLKKHMITHVRERWYKCLRCPQKYRDYLKYMEHKNTHPKDEAAAATSSGSNTPSPKKKPKSKHGYDDSYESNDEDSSVEDWLECCECGQRFTDLESYTEHLKEHDPNLYLYECYICKENFEKRDQLVEHVTKHSEVSKEEAAVVREAVKRKKSMDSE